MLLLGTKKREVRGSLRNNKVWIKGLLLVLLLLSVSGCSNKNKSAYGYWTGVDNRDGVTFDIHVTKDHIIMLEDKGATKYKFKIEDFAGRDTMAISGKELARHIKGMDNETDSFVKVSLINDDKDNPYLNMLTNMEGRLSDAQLYPIDKSDSPLSRVEGSGGSWVMLLIPIGLFIYLSKKGRS